MSDVRFDGYTLDAALKSVGPGWGNLLRALWDKLPPNRIVVQVKEKFGTLRVYHDPRWDASGECPEDDAAFDAAVDAAEAASAHICERCGLVGETIRKPSGWLKTLCENCRNPTEQIARHSYGHRFPIILVLLYFAWAAFSPLFGQASLSRYPQDGKVIDPALSYLRERYRADLEFGYCITKWKVQNDTVVVEEIVESPGILDQGPYHVVFLCPVGTVALHTHPPQFSSPSDQDKMPLLGPESTVPFVVIQFGPEQFGFWIWWTRAALVPSWKGVES